MKWKVRLGPSLVLAMALVLMLSVAPAFAKTSPILVSKLLPDWSTGVYSAYYGPPDYVAVSPGATASYLGRGAGIIKAGLTIDPTDQVYEDQGLFAFQPNMNVSTFAKGPLTYDVTNQYGANPVWMTIEIGNPINRNDNVTYQFVPAPYTAGVWNTVDAGNGLWLKWADNNGNTTGDPMTLAQIAAASPSPHKVMRVYLRLGMGDSYHDNANGTVAWVDKVVIGTTTYDFIAK